MAGIMKVLKRLTQATNGRALVGPLAAAVLLVTPHLSQAQEATRILSLGGAVTEIIYALGEGDRVIGRDSTSSFPPAVLDLPDVGYVRRLSPEGVLSMAPDVIIGTEGLGPPETLQVFQGANIPLTLVPEGYDGAAIFEKIRIVAEALGVPRKGAELSQQVSEALAKALSERETDDTPRVMFILSMQGGRIMAAGSNTGAQGIITLAGGVNALEGFEGYKQVTDEAILLADPDVILMMDRSGDHAADDAEILEHPVLGATKAAQSGAIVRQPGLVLLGFGPRTPEAVRALNAAFAQVQS